MIRPDVPAGGAQQTPGQTPGQTLAQTLGLMALLWLVGLYLRIPILAAAPLAALIAEDLGLGPVGTGAVTMLPVVMLAVGAAPAALIIGRVGVRGALIAGMAVMATASAARGWAGAPALLFTLSAVMGFGIVLFQTALPNAVKAWSPRNVALGSAVYLNGMMVGELAGAGLTLPIVLPLAGGDWRLALLLWSAPVAGIALLLALPRRRDRAGGAPGALLPDLRSREMWSLGLWLAGSIAAFLTINAYMATTLEARGEGGALAAMMLGYNLSPLAASVAMILVGGRLIGRRAPIAVSGLLAAAGVAGFAGLSGVPAGLFAALAGFAATLQLILILSLPPAIAEGAGVARLTAGMTAVGYLLSFLLTLAGGAVAGLTGAPGLTYAPTVALIAGLALTQRLRGRYGQPDAAARPA